MSNDASSAPNPSIVSFQLDGALAEQVDRIAKAEGVSRSDVLRRALLVKLGADLGVMERCVRQLNGIHDQLIDTIEKLEAEDWNPQSLHEAVELVAGCIDELEDSEDEDEDD